MNENTVNVDGQDYIFDPNKVEKPEKQEKDKTPDQEKHKASKDEEKDVQQSKLSQRKNRIDKEKAKDGKVIWTGGRLV